MFPTNIVSSQNIKISQNPPSLNMYSYLRYKGTACLTNIAKHSVQNKGPIKPRYETLDISLELSSPPGRGASRQADP